MNPPETPIEQQKRCLNCDTPLQDRYCAHCGQDSREFRRSVWHIGVQFFETFTELDNTFLRSFWALLFKPGFLTIQYLKGKRKSYLNPIQMYAFFSFLFFLMVFSYPDFVSEEPEISAGKQIEKILNEPDSLGADAVDESKKGGKTNFTIGFPGMKIKVQDTAKSGPIELANHVKSKHAYDSAQAQLPKENRDGFLKRTIKRKFLSINEKMQKKETEGLFDAWIDAFKSNIPNVLIVLLPVFALLLRLVYWRRPWYYVEHLIFGIHLHCFTFFLLSISTFFSQTFRWGEDAGNWVTIWIILYFPLAMKRVYGQSWTKTILKFVFIVLTYLFLLIFALIANLILSALFIGDA